VRHTPGAKRRVSINKTACQWRYLPNDFPPYINVNYYYNKWTKNGTLEAINQALRQQLRLKGGRNPDPTGAVIDSQNVKGTLQSQDDSGFDGGKPIKGRKRHTVVDTNRYIVAVWVHAANMFDGKAARRLLSYALDTVSSIRILWADSAYAGADLAKWLAEQYGCTLEVVKKPECIRGFDVLPRRWVLERPRRRPQRVQADRAYDSRAHRRALRRRRSWRGATRPTAAAWGSRAPGRGAHHRLAAPVSPSAGALRASRGHS
jgi:transposase